MRLEYDVIYLGGGPGGYVGAVTSASLGKKVAVVERKKIGGTCVNVGCIPADAALAAAETLYSAELGVFNGSISLDFKANVQRARDIAKRTSETATYVLQSLNVDVINGGGKLVEKGVQVNGETLHSENVVLATGATPIMPDVDGLDLKRVITRENFWELQELPKKVVVLEGGEPSSDILELSQILAAGGASVKFLDENDEILPWEDAELAASLRESLSKRGFEFNMGIEPKEVKGNKVVYAQNDEEKEAEFDALLVSYGWMPNVEHTGAEQLGVETELGFIKVDETGRTNLPWLYAVGDVTTHLGAASAMHMGRVVALNVAGRHVTMDYNQFPRGCATIPELEGVGLTEEGARRVGINPVVGTAYLAANEKAIVEGRPEGLVKIVSDDKGNIIGGGVLGSHASEVIHEIVLAMRMKATVADLALSNFEHATISESVQEAALKAFSSLG
ncbi:dihydrolipoyl dehydrogenase family protein [Tardisphaera saccharovorans]